MHNRLMLSHSSQRSPDHWLYVSFILLLIWIPLPLGSNREWAWSIMEVWVMVLSLCWCVLYLKNKVQFSSAFRSAKWVIALFLIWLTYLLFQLLPLPLELLEQLSPKAAAIWSSMGQDTGSITVDPYLSKVSLLLSVTYFLVFCLVLNLMTRRRRLKHLCYALICSGLFQAVYGAVMTLSNLEYGFFIKKYAYLGVATGTFVNRNHLAGYLEMTLAIGIGLMIASLDTTTAVTVKQRLLRFLKLLLSTKARIRLSLVMMVIALVLTHSRMGNTAFFISLGLTGVIGLCFSRHATRSTVVLLVSLILIDILIVSQWFGFERLKQRVQDTDTLTEVRVEVFRDVQIQWQDYELTGSGLGSFSSVFPQYRSNDIHGYYREAHNDYLQFAAETGWIGLSLLGLIVGFCLIAALKAHYSRRDPLMRGISFASIMGVTAILIHSLVDFNLQIPANAATFTVLLALSWVSLHLQKQT